MSEQPPTDPRQNLNISDGTSLDNVQIGGIAGRDLNVNQIQGKIIYITANDRIDASDGLTQKSVRETQSLTREEYHARRVLLNKVKNIWIKNVLKSPLHTKALIELGREKRLDLLELPFSEMEEFPEQSRQLIPEDKETIDVFHEMGEGRTLLILGEPGVGKTITLLKLAESLITRTEADLTLPIPVVFNLSSWASKKQTIEEWLVQELKKQYNVDPKKLGKKWVKEEQLLLLLDGLDEVKAEHRNACVKALNQFMQTHGVTEMVVCTRIRDYEMLSERLKLQSAICIQPLTPEQIYQYLEQAGEQLAALKALLQQDAKLQTFATSPLILSVMSWAYQGCSSEELSSLISSDEWQPRLFDKYIERMFQHRKNTQKYSKEKTIRWLSWLARQLEKKSQTIFLIEGLQPNYLHNSATIRIYFLTVSLLIGIISILFVKIIWNYWIDGLTIGLSYGVGSYLVQGKIAKDKKRREILGIFFGFCVFLLGSFLWWLHGATYKPWGEAIGVGALVGLGNWSTDEIQPFDKFQWDWRLGISKGLKIALLGALFGTIYGTINIPDFLIKLTNDYPTLTFAEKIIGVIIAILTISIIFGGIIGLIGFFVSGITGKTIEEKTIPNQAIRKSIVASIIIGLICMLCIGLWGSLNPIAIFQDDAFDLYTFIYAGLFVGGGMACLQHLILRIFLYRQNFIPWNYARFLNYATERNFLQKVGGGYIFVHRMLMEHFAKIDTKLMR